MSDEQALKLLLASWRAPAAPDALRARVVNSYREELQRSVAEEGEEMKRCPMCHAEFAPQFRFCPLDGLPLVAGLEARPAADTLAQLEQTSSERLHAPVATLAEVHEFDSVAIESLLPEDAGTVTATRVNARTRAEYQLTLLAEASLYARLTTELRAAGRESQLTWPELKRDPVGFARRTAVGYGLLLRRLVAQEHVAQAMVAAFVVILSLVGAVVALDRYHRAQRSALARVNESEYELVGWANAIPNEPKQEEGPAGMAARGTGGGSLANKERPGGGGGGGRHEALPASSGKLPPATWQPQLQAPDPKPPVVQNAQLPTVTTLQGDPVLFPPDPRPLPYGDPKSQATDPSSGAGDGNGIGDGHGGGVGTGDGNGYGPGRDGNTGGGPMKPGGGGKVAAVARPITPTRPSPCAM